jgi:soluble lytic murein transglycosylase
LGSDTLLALSEQLATRGLYRESIQVALRITPGGPDVAGDAEFVPEDHAPQRVLELRYPQAYASVFDEVLSEEDVDPAVLYALVREESLFDPDIVSAAGAVGLAQLLPETAEDIARRMRLTVTDLTDPLPNLRIGARYISMLEEQFGDVFKALAAYNAGQGRVRGWERRWPQLHGLLFHRAIPFSETYLHIKKVVVSTVYYGYLYENQSVEETLRSAFPELTRF